MGAAAERTIMVAAKHRQQIFCDSPALALNPREISISYQTSERIDAVVAAAAAMMAKRSRRRCRWKDRFCGIPNSSPDSGQGYIRSDH